MKLLEGLKRYTKIVADTGDYESIDQFHPEEVTTNPTLIYKLLTQKKYENFLTQAISWTKSSLKHSSREQAACIVDTLLVLVGEQILKKVPGRVSAEVDVRLSFDTRATVQRARGLIAKYAERGIDKKRILIKIASTWEGIKAAEVLEKEGIHCNLTLLFDKAQAIACAESNVTLISPFVGRIYDWYREKNLLKDGAEDPGVQSVKEIYNYYKGFGYKTEIMGASFRKVEQILALAGCDRLTISPALLEQLHAQEGNVTCALAFNALELQSKKPRKKLSEASFRWCLNENAMATEKLSEGIRLFKQDTERLEALIQSRL